ncbi:hypothetical protein GCM10020218_059690 [Dactylosporangium vinaceum]
MPHVRDHAVDVEYRERVLHGPKSARTRPAPCTDPAPHPPPPKLERHHTGASDRRSGIMRAFLRTTLIAAAATAGLVGAGTPALAAPEGTILGANGAGTIRDRYIVVFKDSVAASSTAADLPAELLEHSRLASAAVLEAATESLNTTMYLSRMVPAPLAPRMVPSGAASAACRRRPGRRWPRPRSGSYGGTLA